MPGLNSQPVEKLAFKTQHNKFLSTDSNHLISKKQSVDYPGAATKSDEDEMESLVLASNQTLYKTGLNFRKRKVKQARPKLASLNQNSKIGASTSKFDQPSNSVSIQNFEKPPKSLFEPKTYIGPGNLGTQKTQVMWNRSSNQ